MTQSRKGKNIQMDSNCVRWVKQKRASTCCGCLLLWGKSLPRKRQRQHGTRQVLYGTTVYVALCYLALSSVRVYPLIRWHVAGTSKGSCNLAEHTAEGRQWSKLGGWGWTCIQVLLKGLVAPNRKHHQTSPANNITGIRSTVLRFASWLSLSSMTSSEVISVYAV